MNGGLRLEEQPIDDMLDMLHYLFESDSLTDEDVDKAKRRMRQQIYKLLYLRDYTWQDGADDTRYREFGTQDAGVDPTGGTAPKFEHKPYIPPTPMSDNPALPFGNVLDAPLG